MRRITIIAFLVVSVIAVSCSKISPRPDVSNGEQLPQWKTSSSAPTDTDPNATDDGSITDPNNDEDNNRRKKH